MIRLVALWCGTPRTTFAENEDYISVRNTDPPVRGVQFHTLTLTSFLSRKARGFLDHIVTSFLIFHFFASLLLR